MLERIPVRDVVVCYDFFPQVGGAHLWLYEVYRRWAGEVQLLTLRHSADESEATRQRAFDSVQHGAVRIAREAPPHTEIDLLDVRYLATLRAQVREIRRLTEGRKARLHALRAFPEGFVAYLYRITHPRNSRLITYAHGEEVLVAQSSRQLKWIARRVYAASDLVIANSENTRRIVEALCPRARVLCVHPGVEATAFIRDEREISSYRQRLNWPADTTITCTLARMEPRKNHIATIRAVADLRNQGLPIAHVCGSDGVELQHLRSVATELGISDWVRFVGHVSNEEKPLVYCASDIHAMPSIQAGAMIEGFGIVFLEAAAAGRPSVAGKNGGQAEAVLDGRTGIIVDGTKPSEVAAALAKLALDPALRTTMGRNGRVWAAEHDWPVVVRNIESALATIP